MFGFLFLLVTLTFVLVGFVEFSSEGKMFGSWVVMLESGFLEPIGVVVFVVERFVELFLFSDVDVVFVFVSFLV